MWGILSRISALSCRSWKMVTTNHFSEIVLVIFTYTNFELCNYSKYGVQIYD